MTDQARKREELVKEISVIVHKNADHYWCNPKAEYDIADFILSKTQSLRERVEELEQSLAINKGIAEMGVGFNAQKNKKIAELEQKVSEAVKMLKEKRELATEADYETFAQLISAIDSALSILGKG
jgi:hypothetical protein